MNKLLILFIFAALNAMANPYVIRHNFSDTYLKIEVLQNRGLHFELLSKRPAGDRIWTSPMIKNIPALANTVTSLGNYLKNDDFEIKVNQDNLCVSVKDLHQNWDFITTCPHNFENPWKGLALFTDDARNAYGLGAYYQNPGSADGDWVGKVWDPKAHTMGNALRNFSKGAQSYAIFPVLYVLGSENKNYMLLYDSVYKQMWSLNQSPWKVEGYGDQVRWFLFTDANVKKLRQKFMNLTGKAPVPPKPAFGMWLSEFGYENWSEVYEEVDSMHSRSLPVDGVSLDLQWFGGSFYQGDVDRSTSRFGALSFDQRNFPNPKDTISHLKNEMGVEVMTIEESYISKWLPEFKELEQKGFMAKNCNGLSTTILSANPWWGIGGMIDWTNPDAGQFWHNKKRQKLYELGISYHWTDLGEPEMYDPGSCYYGFHELNKHQHGDIHNIYNLKWVESIAKGYESNRNEKRPFTMTRSGTIGVQRYGAAMWSGDIAANMGALTAHYNTQMHMSYSGVDYFGADIGGFHRRAGTLDGDQHELYTQWFANAVLFDFPVRAHTWNLSNQLETAPSKIGDYNSNRFNLNLRYTLMPYYYSLSHNAYKTGEAIIAPMSMEFQKDLKVRKIGNQKMIGSYLLGAISARYGEFERNVYLPEGNWVDYHTSQKYSSRGQNVFNIKTNENGVFRIPLFVRQGAIIPRLKDLNGQRKNISGKLFNGSSNQDLDILVYPSDESTSFTHYDDDGETVAYKKGEIASTNITQSKSGSTIVVTIEETRGQYKNMPESKFYELELINGDSAKSVSFNGDKLPRCESNKSNCYENSRLGLKIYLGMLNQRTIKEIKVNL